MAVFNLAVGKVFTSVNSTVHVNGK